MAKADTPGSNINNSIADYIETMSLDAEGTLKSIDLTLKAIARQDGVTISQSTLKDFAEMERQQNARDQRAQRSQQARDARRQSASGQSGSGQYSRYNNSEDAYRRRAPKKDMFDDFEKAFKKELFKSVNPLSDIMKKSLKDFADKLGTDVSGLGTKLGETLGKMATNSLKQSRFGQQLMREWEGLGRQFASRATNAMGGFGDAMRRASEDPNASFRSVFNEGMSTARDNMRRNFQDAATNMGDLGDIPNQGSANAGRSGFNDILQEEVASMVRNFGGDAAEAINASGLSQSAEAAAQAASVAEETSTALAVVEQGAAEAGAAASSMAPALSSAGAELASTGAAAAGASTELATLGGGAAAAGAAFPYATAAIIAASIAIDKLSEVFGPAIDGFKSFWKALKSAGNRFKEQNNKNLELWKNRVKEDMVSVTKAAFDVIEESAQKALDTWDAVSGTIAATQGYEKEGVQALWSAYANRLKDAGLEKYVSSADIMTNLESILKQGLSGDVAEEFAYEATKLNKAMPTIDFFQYAQTYASIVANQAKNGEDLTQALKLANSELESFAGNLLYADRQLAGGMAMDISNGAKLFEEATKIALTSRDMTTGKPLGDISDISGVLTSVSAIVSAIAPDVADSLVSAITEAALGGNSSNITALRSMAGIGASNTAFLQALAKAPQKVFSDLFTNLAKLQGMSSANYMEVAEALSDVFGLSMDAFARVDFKYLADAINAMDLSNKAVNERMDLLQSGETTSTAEQLRMQKINEYMIEEGLAFVLDSEVGRAVQQHMWDEQLARQIEENTFAVELQGSALEFLEGIWNTIQSILDFLNPFSWIGKLVNIGLTANEAAAQSEDLREMLKATQVGSGNDAAWTRLTKGNIDLRNNGLFSLGGTDRKNYSDMLMGKSSTSEAKQQLDNWRNFSLNQSLTELVDGASNVDKLASEVEKASKSAAAAAMSGHGAIVSKYAALSILKDTGRSSSGFYSGNASESMYTPTWGAQAKEARKVFGSIKDYKGNELFKDEGYTSTPGLTDEQKYDEALEYADKLGTALQTSMSSYLANSGQSGENYKSIVNKVKTNEFTEALMEGVIPLKNSANVKFKNSSNIARKISEGEIDPGKILRTYNISAYTTEGGKLSAAASDLTNRTYLTTDDFMKSLQKYESLKEDTSFVAWAKNLGFENLKELEKVTEAYGSSVSALQAQFNQLQAQQDTKRTKARDMHEEQFWSDMQNFATLLFPEYLNEWKKYFVMHTAYTSSIDSAYKEAMNVNAESAGQEADAVLTLANKLTDNSLWAGFAADIANPTVQTNMLLAKILVIVEAIMQQNNETSIVSVPTALSSMGLGIVTSTAGDGAKNTKNKEKK